MQRVCYSILKGDLYVEYSSMYDWAVIKDLVSISVTV